MLTYDSILMCHWHVQDFLQHGVVRHLRQLVDVRICNSRRTAVAAAATMFRKVSIRSQIGWQTNIVTPSALHLCPLFQRARVDNI
jgi:hypothetical protein